jgi:hypothetical protein
MPQLGEFIANGPSRHRLRKGLLITSPRKGRQANHEEQEFVVRRSNAELGVEGLPVYAVEPDANHPALISIVTPFTSIHTRYHRNIFFRQLAHAMTVIHSVCQSLGLSVVGAGIDPFVAPSAGQPPALCADIHEIEILDDLEVNRIYNLFRQYLPELIAVSTNSAIHGSQLQRDLSTRMRQNPASFTPPSLTLFSSKQLERLKRSIRKDYGLSDLAQLDVNPISPNTMVLRFVDAQVSLRFIRAQLLLFQAIAIHGRTLARQGSQMPTLHSRVIGENKALAIEGGPGAIFKPDKKREVKRTSPWYQDRKVAERASTALLEMLRHRTVDDKNTTLAAMRNLKAEYDELSPWLLGAELRRKGEACLVSYGEYQLRLFYVSKNNWREQLLADQIRLLTDPSADALCDYNEAKFPEINQTMTREWNEILDH